MQEGSKKVLKIIKTNKIVLSVPTEACEQSLGPVNMVKKGAKLDG